MDFNLDIIDGREIALDQLISSIETLPFMDDRKIVILKDFELLKFKIEEGETIEPEYFLPIIPTILLNFYLLFILLYYFATIY